MVDKNLFNSSKTTFPQLFETNDSMSPFNQQQDAVISSNQPEKRKSCHKPPSTRDGNSRLFAKFA